MDTPPAGAGTPGHGTQSGSPGDTRSGEKMLDEAKIGCVKLTTHKDCIICAFSFEQQGVSLRDASNMKTS